MREFMERPRGVGRWMPVALLGALSIALLGSAVAADDGLNHGLVNWPVASVRGEQLIRLNMGGSASVTIRLTDGSRIQAVVHDETEARRIAAAVG